MPAAEFLARLKDVHGGNGKWRARCPAHNDHSPSLSISVGNDGRVLLKCHSGCSVDDVVSAVGLTMTDLFSPASSRPLSLPTPVSALGKIIATYDYRDERGELLYQGIRYQPKDFRVRRPNGKGGWTWNLEGVPRVLYRLRETLAAKAEGRGIVFVEGEKDCDALVALGMVATTVQGGAGAPLPDDIAETLQEAKVAILPDNDAAGHAFADRLARTLYGHASRITVVSLPDLGDKEDVSDWLLRGGTREQLNALIKSAPDFLLSTDSDLSATDQKPSSLAPSRPMPAPNEENGQGAGGHGRVAQAEQVVRLANERYVLGATTAGEPFAIERGGANLARMFRGNRDGFRASLAREYRRQAGKTPSGSALTDALTVLEGEAADTAPTPVALRIAQHHDDLVLDLGDTSGSAVVVNASGWQVVTQSTVTFRRTALSGALPPPVAGEDLAALGALLNVPRATLALVIGWLVASFLPDIPHPVLMIGGEQGAGKSSAGRIIVELVDPSPAPMRSEPRDPEAWAMIASGSWIVLIDNVSGISTWLSDAICKAVTGDGWVRRRLYSDSELSVLAFRRCVILTSIDAGALRGDLADRLLLIDLDRIADTARRTEADLRAEYERLRPALLGALLDVVVAVLRELPSINLQTLPRMADFARVLAALDVARPDLTDGMALQTYLEQRERLATEVVESDAVAMEIVRLVEQGPWSGTAEELRSRLTPERAPREWPASARALSGRLRRLIPALLKVCVLVHIPKTRTKVGRIITIRRTNGKSGEPGDGDGVTVEDAHHDLFNLEVERRAVQMDRVLQQGAEPPSLRTPSVPRPAKPGDGRVTVVRRDDPIVTTALPLTGARGDGGDRVSASLRNDDEAYAEAERLGIANDGVEVEAGAPLLRKRMTL